MTHIAITRATNLYGIEISGHSGYADEGSDIVCAGISALGDSFVMMAEDYNKSKNVSIKIYESDNGYIHILYYDPGAILRPAFDMLEMGLTSIRDQFPYNVEIIYK